MYTSTDSGGIDSTNAALGDTNSAGSGGVVAGVVVLVLALSIVAVVTTVILVIVFKKQAKNNCCNLQSHNGHTRGIMALVNKGTQVVLILFSFMTIIYIYLLFQMIVLMILGVLILHVSMQLDVACMMRLEI